MGLAEQELQGITVTSLPPVSQGALVLDGVEVEAYEYLDREAISRMCFVASEDAANASVTFIPKSADARTTYLSIQVLSQPNSAPQIEGGSFDTVKNQSVTSYISATDPDGDPVTLRLVGMPKKGEVTFNGLAFTYTPYTGKTGSDTFTVCAVDSHSNYSQEATFSVKIGGSTRNAFSYVDMYTHPSQYAAIKLHEMGIYTGQHMGSSYYFLPDRNMSRGEFLMMLLSAAGLQGSVTATVNTGLPNDGQLPTWIKPYVKKAIDEGILSAGQPFVHYEAITRAEAVVYTHRASKIDDVKDYTLTMGDHGSIPEWAVKAYKDLAAYRILDLNDGNAYPYGTLTNYYAADLVWQLYKHCNR